MVHNNPESQQITPCFYYLVKYLKYNGITYILKGKYWILMLML